LLRAIEIAYLIEIEVLKSVQTHATPPLKKPVNDKNGWAWARTIRACDHVVGLLAY
jgi:hypothetical protein